MTKEEFLNQEELIALMLETPQDLRVRWQTVLTRTLDVTEPDIIEPIGFFMGRFIKIGLRLAQRHLSGQAGEGMDKDAQALIDLMSEMPTELRVRL